MIASGRHLIAEIQKGAVAALIILLASCAGLTSFAAGAQTTREAPARVVAARGASAAPLARASERQIAPTKATLAEDGLGLPLMPLPAVAEPMARPPRPHFTARTLLGLLQPALFLYEARAPPSA